MGMQRDTCRSVKLLRNIWATARAVRCEPSQILVTTGSQQGLQLSAQVLLDTNERVWVEEPGYPGARQALMMAGAKLVPVPVGHQGLDVGEGIRRARSAHAVYITPSHQYPLGVTMTAHGECCCSI